MPIHKINGVNATILFLILQAAIKKYPNYFVVGLETTGNRYDVTFSTTIKPLSGHGFTDQYKIENNEAVFMERIMSFMS